MARDSPFAEPLASPGQLIRALGLRPSKALGQHFLHDRKVVSRIVDAADVTLSDAVLEIGPGLGILTRELVARAATVVAVEADPTLAERLTDNAPENLRVVVADARTIEPAQFFDGRYKVVANLPYSVANRILRTLLEAEPPPTSLTVMVQREVAERIVARPPKMSLLSTAVQFFGVPRILFRIGRGAFTPPPNVESAVIQVKTRTPPLPRKEWPAFFDMIRTGYGHRRKQLANNLGMKERFSRERVIDGLQQIGQPATARAEQLDVANWVVLYRLLRETPPTQ